MLWKWCTQYASKFGKLSSDHRTRKCQFSFQCQWICSNYCTISLISRTRKVMLEVLQARRQQYMICELPVVQAVLRKDRETRDQLANIPCTIKKAREFQINIYFCFFWQCQSLWLCESQQTGRFFKKWEYQTTWPASWEISRQVRKQQLELDMEQQTGSK